MMVPGQLVTYRRALHTASAAELLPAVLVELHSAASARIRTEDGKVHTVRLANLSPRRTRAVRT